MTQMPPMRTAMRQMVGVFGGLDRRLITRRLRDGRRAKAAQGGKAVGRYPFGWAEDGEVAREQRVDGRWGWRRSAIDVTA